MMFARFLRRRRVRQQNHLILVYTASPTPIADEARRWLNSLGRAA